MSTATSTESKPAPPPVETIGLCVFVKEALEFARLAGKSAVNELRRQVPDGQPGDAALGLRRLARIADNERIDHRQRAGHDFREAFRRERDRLAGQPFERAMRAHVDERIGFRHVLQPEPEGDERVPRRQQRIVVVGAALRRAAAVGRQRDQKLAECLRAETKAAVAHVGIVGRLAPGIAQPRDRGIRHARQQGFVFADTERGLIAGGERVDDLEIHAPDRMAAVIAAERVELGVLCVPAEASQAVAEALVAAGVRGLLNFAPGVLRLPPGVNVVSVDLTVQLEQLAFLVNGGE